MKARWKAYFGVFLRMLGILVASILTAGILVTAVNLIPISQERYDALVWEVDEEPLFPKVTDYSGTGGSFHSMEPTSMELATDSLIVKMAAYCGEGAGIQQAFRCISTHYGEEYSRYWHGYVVFLRPLLKFFSYSEMRLLNFAAQILLVFGTGLLMFRKKGAGGVLWVGSVYFLLMPPALAMCFQYSSAFYASFLPLLIYLWKQDYWEEKGRYSYLFLGTGIFMAFVDLLTYPLLSYGLLTVVMLITCKKEGILRYLYRTVGGGLCWLLGYAGMWAGKWVLGSLVLRENLFSRAIEEIFVFTTTEGGISLLDRLLIIHTNVVTFSYRLYLILILCWVLVWAVSLIRKGFRGNPAMPALLLVAMAPLAWYFVVYGHSEMHHIFTHRVFVITLGALFGMVLSGREEHPRGKLPVRLALVALCGVLGFLGGHMVKNYASDYNWTSAFDELPVTQMILLDYVPQHEGTTRLFLGLKGENVTQGEAIVTIFENENAIYERELPLAGLEGVFLEVPVDVKLQEGETYQVLLEIRDCDRVLYTYSMTEGTALADYGPTSIVDNVETSGQNLLGVEYLAGLRIRKERVVYEALFAAFFLALTECFTALRARPVRQS